jgi:hypothetical protein
MVNHFMFSHIVVFWTNPHRLDAADELLAGANQLLKNIPGVLQFHAGKMMPSHRPVVDQTYQVALTRLYGQKGRARIPNASAACGIRGELCEAARAESCRLRF